MTTPDLLTTARVAEMHGVTPARIRAIASSRAIVPAVDEPRYKMWTGEQARALKPGKTGRPPNPRSPRSPRSPRTPRA